LAPGSGCGAASGDVARVLHATGLDKVLPLYPDVASAMEL